MAYYQTDHDQDLSVTALRRKLAKNLPNHMIPNAFVRMQAFPMTPSGKLDREALPAPDDSRPVLENELVPARTEVERTLTEIWKEVLERKEVGVTDDFFALGEIPCRRPSCCI